MSDKQTEQFLEHQREIKNEKEYYQSLEEWKDAVKKYLDGMIERNKETLADLEYIKTKLSSLE